MVDVQRPFDLPDVQLHVPAMSVKLHDLLRRIVDRIDQRRHDDNALAPPSPTGERVADHPQLLRFRDRRVFLDAHPLRSLRAFPRHEPVVLAEPLAATEIDAAFRVDSRADVDAAPAEQGEHHVRTAVTVEHSDVARIEGTEGPAVQASGASAPLQLLAPVGRLPFRAEIDLCENERRNADHTVPMSELARVILGSHRVEDCFRRAKDECGLAEYEVQSWPGRHHHMALALPAAFFLTKETFRSKKRARR